MISSLPLQFFVLDIVTIFLFIVLAVQTLYIIKLSHRLKEQNEIITELKEVVYAVYEASKGNKDVRVNTVKLSKDGK